MGTIKWFDATKGYGFFCPDNGGKDVFVHMSNLMKSGIEKMNPGEKVRFMIEKSDNGKTKAVALERA